MTDMTVHNLTISSRELSQKTGVRHDNLKRSMTALNKRGELPFTQTEEMVRIGSEALRKTKIYHIKQEDVPVLAAHLNRAFAIKAARQYVPQPGTLNRLPDDPRALGLPNFNDPVESARAWALESEKRQTAETNLIETQKQLEEAAPAIHFEENYNATHDLKSFRDLARLIPVNERTLSKFLINSRICYRKRPYNNLMPFKYHINKGRFKIRVFAKNGHNGEQMMFTPKGVIWIIDLWKKHLEKASGSVVELTFFPPDASQ